MRNPFAHGGFQDRSRPFLWGVTVVLGLLLAASFWVKPVWRSIKDRRALAFVANARAAMATNDFSVSVAHLRAAHALSPFHPEVLRATGTHFSQLSRPEGLVYWHQLEDSKRITDEDRFAYARLALDHGALEAARSAIKPLGHTRPHDPDALKLLAELYLGASEPELAAGTLREALDGAPFRPDLQILLSRIELAQTNGGLRSGAKARLFQVVTAAPAHRADAAFALLQDGGIDAAELRLLAALVKPVRGDQADVWLAQLVIRLRQRLKTLPEAILEFRQGAGLDEKGADFQTSLTRLVSLGEFGAVASLVPLELAVKHRDLLPFRLEALAGLRDSAGLEAILKESKSTIDPAQAAVYEALSASFSRRTNQIPLLWQAAVTENRKNYPVLKVVAERAEQEGATTAAVGAWETLLLQPDWARQAAWKLIRLTANSPDPLPTLKAYQRLATLQPKRPEFELQINFYRLFLDVDAPAAQEFLSKGCQPGADRKLFGVTQALAALRDNDPDRALRELDAVSINWDKAPRSWRVIRASALARGGQYGLAREVAKALDFTQLGPRELELLGGLKEKAGR